jgi:hypothetical protein
MLGDRVEGACVAAEPRQVRERARDVAGVELLRVRSNGFTNRPETVCR